MVCVCACVCVFALYVSVCECELGCVAVCVILGCVRCCPRPSHQLISYNASTLRSAADSVYLMGREGPSIASMVQPGLKVVLPDMSISPSAQGNMTLAHADVAVRQGKWYFEIEITHWPEVGHGGYRPTTLAVGCVAPHSKLFPCCRMG